MEGAHTSDSLSRAAELEVAISETLEGIWSLKRDIAERNAEKAARGDSQTRHAERLMQSARKRDEKRQRLREAKESEELSKCSGTPKINSKSRSIATRHRTRESLADRLTRQKKNAEERHKRMRKQMQEKEEKSVRGTPKINRSSRRMSRTVEDMSKWEEKKRKRLEAARMQKELALMEQKKAQSKKKMSRGSRNILRRKEKQLQVEKEIEARRLRWRTPEEKQHSEETQKAHGADVEVIPKDSDEVVTSTPKDDATSSEKAAIGDRLLKMAETYRSKRLERIKKERQKQQNRSTPKISNVAKKIKRDEKVSDRLYRLAKEKAERKAQARLEKKLEEESNGRDRTQQPDRLKAREDSTPAVGVSATAPVHVDAAKEGASVQSPEQHFLAFLRARDAFVEERAERGANRMEDEYEEDEAYYDNDDDEDHDDDDDDDVPPAVAAALARAAQAAAVAAPTAAPSVLTLSPEERKDPKRDNKKRVPVEERLAAQGKKYKNARERRSLLHKLKHLAKSEKRAISKRSEKLARRREVKTSTPGKMRLQQPIGRIKENTMKSINAPTFRPNIGRNDARSDDPPTVAPSETMFDRNQRWADEVKGRLAEKRAQKEERQSEICTFSPKIGGEARPRRKAPQVPSSG